jgi:hypothetical protein
MISFDSPAQIYIRQQTMCKNKHAKREPSTSRSKFCMSKTCVFHTNTSIFYKINIAKIQSLQLSATKGVIRNHAVEYEVSK